jgi:hypothetical protein
MIIFLLKLVFRRAIGGATAANNDYTAYCPAHESDDDAYAFGAP